MKNWEKRFYKEFGQSLFTNCLGGFSRVDRRIDLKNFIKEELATQRMKAITMVKDEVVKADKYTIGALEKVRVNMTMNL